ncbi:hypothetical protein BV898_06112 [Hypsibius exemplaris]|uniref:Ribosomal protein eL8/eL30/eS12/Gadd45 domain-containing protein n=1 Tax=Hypsibius exemplaris TaxID=2072580 RepID=A0A1W0WXA7_HYPEX|nr:hypothetical protein BV898_06112 [Hypsibius exemplaris]
MMPLMDKLSLNCADSEMLLSSVNAKCGPSREADLVHALLESLRIAKMEYRIRIGLSSSLKILEIDPSSVVMCVIPAMRAKKDALTHLQLTLIEAYCTENDIRLLQVLSPEELLNIVKPSAETDTEDDSMEEEFDDDSGLVVIQAASYDNEKDDELQKIYDLACLHHNTRPIIRLPS